MQVVVTVIKVGLIAAIIVIGLAYGAWERGELPHRNSGAGGIAGFFAALVAALWAYDGWNNVSMVSSEIREPAAQSSTGADCRTLARDRDLSARERGLFLRAVGRRRWRQRSCGGRNDAADLGDWGRGAVSIAAMISIFAALNGSILSGSRVPFAMARDGLFFRVGGARPSEHRTPSVSILALSAWGALLVLERTLRSAVYLRDLRQRRFCTGWRPPR